MYKTKWVVKTSKWQAQRNHTLRSTCMSDCPQSVTKWVYFPPQPSFGLRTDLTSCSRLELTGLCNQGTKYTSRNYNVQRKENIRKGAFKINWSNCLIYRWRHNTRVFARLRARRWASECIPVSVLSEDTKQSPEYKTKKGLSISLHLKTEETSATKTENPKEQRAPPTDPLST